MAKTPAKFLALLATLASLARSFSPKVRFANFLINFRRKKTWQYQCQMSRL